MPTQNWGSNDVNGTSFLLNPANVARVAPVAGDANLARMGFIGASHPEVTWSGTPANLAINLNGLTTVAEGDFLALPLVGGGRLYIREATFAEATADPADPENRSYLWTTEGPEIRWHIDLNLTEIDQVFFPVPP